MTKSSFVQAMQASEVPLLMACLNLEANGDQESVLKDASRRMNSRFRIGVLRSHDLEWFSKKYRIVGTPTYLLFADGEEQGRLLGKIELDTLLGFVTSKLSQKNEVEP